MVYILASNFINGFEEQGEMQCSQESYLTTLCFTLLWSLVTPLESMRMSIYSKTYCCISDTWPPSVDWWHGALVVARRVLFCLLLEGLTVHPSWTSQLSQELGDKMVYWALEWRCLGLKLGYKINPFCDLKYSIVFYKAWSLLICKLDISVSLSSCRSCEK